MLRSFRKLHQVTHHITTTPGHPVFPASRITVLTFHRSFAMHTVPQSYRAYVHENFGNALNEIQLRTVKKEVLKPSQVCVKVYAAGYNPIDTKLIEHGAIYGKTRPSKEAPFRMGLDVAGVLVEVGNDVKHLHVGDGVFAKAGFANRGTFAEYAVLEAEEVGRKPTNLTFIEASGMALCALTSFQSLKYGGQVKHGDRVLILGGSSATGAYGIQIAKALGAHVITTTSTRNLDLAIARGADQVIDYTAGDWADQVEPHSIDVIFTGVEPNAWNDRAQRVLKPKTGVFVDIGRTQNPIESPIGATYKFVAGATSTADLKTITEYIDAGVLTPLIDSVHRFEDLLDVVKIQSSNHTRGKLILQMTSEAEHK